MDDATRPVGPGVSIHQASLGSRGEVYKGLRLKEDDAISLRRAGSDVVVCGPEIAENRRVAKRIEEAVGPSRRHVPHESAGPASLPHFQPQDRPPAGHTFYETPQRKAKRP